MKYPTLSIVIPCYNEEKLVAKCLWHILNQTVLPEEVIFVDNNSTDKSIEIAESFVDKFKDVGVDFEILEEKEKGITPTRILGFSSVTKDLIGMIDVDTLISRNWVKIAKKVFAKHKTLTSITGPLTFHNINFFWRNYSKLAFISYKIKFFFIMWGCNGVFNKKAYDRIGGLSEHHIMKRKLGLRWDYMDNYLSEKFKLIGKTKCILRLKATGESRTDKKRYSDQLKQFWRIKKYIRKKYKK